MCYGLHIEKCLKSLMKCIAVWFLTREIDTKVFGQFMSVMMNTVDLLS